MILPPPASALLRPRIPRSRTPARETNLQILGICCHLPISTSTRNPTTFDNRLKVSRLRNKPKIRPTLRFQPKLTQIDKNTAGVCGYRTDSANFLPFLTGNVAAHRDKLSLRQRAKMSQTTRLSSTVPIGLFYKSLQVSHLCSESSPWHVHCDRRRKYAVRHLKRATH